MENRNLSESTILKYSGAISGALSEWASSSGILNCNISSISDPIRFDFIAQEISKLPIFLERNKTGHNMYSCALEKYSEFLSAVNIEPIEADIAEIVSSGIISNTEKSTLIKARIGQGQFRQDLIDLWGGCSVTGYNNAAMLLASHVKPWAESTNKERLDKYNGLLLLPNIDRAFDKGLVTFSGTGTIVISALLSKPLEIGINPSMSVNLNEQQELYMRYHRQKVFKNL